jgi:hypothetical protein
MSHSAMLPKPETALGPRSIVMGIALVAIGFVAASMLLIGLMSLVQPSRGGTPSVSPTTRASVPSNRPSLAGLAFDPVSLSGAASSESSSDGRASGPTSAPGPTSLSRSIAASRDPVLVGAGDIADCGLRADTATARLVATIGGTVFTAGDNAYPNGSARQFRACYGPTWGRFRTRTRPAPGNHDWVTRRLAGYRGYFGARAAPKGTSWYSYDLGTWHVIVLDSDCSFVGGCGPRSTQGRWLAADLRASAKRCTLAIWHHPRFSSGQHGNATSVAPFWRALYKAGAEVVINGHDHDYERFAPQTPTGRADAARGIREFVVGTGGAALRPFARSAPNSQHRTARAHGVIRLVLHATSYEWRFIPTAGRFRDSGNGQCH